jgi:hypothetical protein
LDVSDDIEKDPRWKTVLEYANSSQEPLWRIGILEADSILFEALKNRGYSGDDVGEILREANFITIQRAWNAHKIRNRIAHEGSKFRLTEREAKKTFADYEAVFKEMKII